MGGPRLFYSHSLNVAEEDFLCKISYSSNNDCVMSVLINEGMSGNTTSYYERARDSDLPAWGNLLLRKKLLLGGRARNRLLLEEEANCP